jgi:hypothetical protein
MELYPSVGTPLDEIEPFTQELTGIVETMQESLATETRILEGAMPMPDYTLLRQALENELSIPKLTEEQWRTRCPSGSSTIGPTLTSTPASSSSSCSAEASIPVLDTQSSGGVSCSAPTNCCKARSDGSGCEIDASNGCCACMVQTINVPTVGMPSEAK